MHQEERCGFSLPRSWVVWPVGSIDDDVFLFLPYLLRSLLGSELGIVILGIVFLDHRWTLFPLLYRLEVGATATSGDSAALFRWRYNNLLAIVLLHQGLGFLVLRVVHQLLLSLWFDRRIIIRDLHFLFVFDRWIGIDLLGHLAVGLHISTLLPVLFHVLVYLFPSGDTHHIILCVLFVFLSSAPELLDNRLLLESSFRSVAV
jgi:hypothetical protein